MQRIARLRPVLLATVALASLAAAACGTASSGAQAAHAGVTGYKWTVIAITHDGRETAIPADDDVYLAFTPSGQFLANDPVNSHSGTYRMTGVGFTTSALVVSAVGYIGHDPVTVLAIGAISSFDTHPSAVVRNLSGNTIAIDVNGYMLTCQRAGEQPDFPAAAHIWSN